MSEPQHRRSSGTILGGGRRRPSVEQLTPTPAPEPEEKDPNSLRSIHDDLDAAPEPAPAPRQARPTRPGPRTDALIWKVALAGVAALALVIALLGLRERSALHHDRSQRTAVQDVSGRWVGALINLDYQHLDAWRTSVLQLSSDAVNKSFQQIFGGLEQLYVADHLRSTGTVQSIFVGTISAGKASTVVLVNTTITGLTGTQQRGSYVQLSLLNVHGKWLIDHIDEVNFQPGSTGSAGNSGTTPTTGPTPSTPSTNARP
jgi:hypothetical protein